MKKLLLIPVTSLLVLMMFTTSFATSSPAHAASVQAMQPQAHAVALAPTHTLMPAVTCSGNGCTNQDPIQTGCSASASTVLSAGIFNGSQRVGTINLRFSSVCQTNWAQVLSSVGSVPLFAQVTRIGGVDGPTFFPCEPEDCNSTVTATSAFTNMVWAPDVPTRANGTVLNFSGCVTQDQDELPC